MKKTTLILFCVLLLIPFSYAWMPENHAYFTIEGFRTTNSPITTLCQDREEQIIFGNAAADVPVIHYLENDLEGYKGTHSRAVYTKCLEIAGSDKDLKCFCYGVGLHLVQDVVSHYDVVPLYIQKYFGSNKLLHPIIEINTRAQTLERLKANPSAVATEEEIKQAAKYSLDLFYKDAKYYQLFQEATGLDMRQDFAAVDAALRGERWKDVVYGKKVSLPSWYWVVSGSIAIIGIFWVVLTRLISRNKLGILSYFIGGALSIFGVLLLISLATGQSWIWYNNIAKIPAAMMNIEDSSKWDIEALQNTKNFFANEQLINDGSLVSDASGLSHTDSQNNWVKGPLDAAEGRFKYFLFPMLAIIAVALTVLLFWKMSKSK
jgi:hypothetical protein